MSQQRNLHSSEEAVSAVAGGAGNDLADSIAAAKASTKMVHIPS